MKTTGYIIAAILAALTGLAALDLSGILPLLGDFLPEKAVKFIAIVPSLAAMLVHAVQAAKQHFEKIGLLMLLLAACSLSLSSCAGIVSGITGQVPHATTVQREGGKPVRIVTSDLLQAESGPPEKVHGLYDVGMVAAGVSTVMDSGK